VSILLCDISVSSYHNQCSWSNDYPLKNSQAVKKGAALCKMASMKKVGWRPRNGCDGRSVTTILITTIQVNLC